jgi:hypothetical protein
MWHRRWVRAAAWLLAGLTSCALAAVLVLVALNVSRGGAGRTGGDALLAVAIAVGAATSQLIISRRPWNAIGWLLGVGGLSLVGSMLGEQYALYGLATAPGSLPAALIHPLRRRVQQLVDRRFNRARYDAEQTVAAFAARLKDALNLDSIRDDLAGAVDQALEPAHISVWISPRD